jgi:lysyl-tRNA synthetase class 2
MSEDWRPACGREALVLRGALLAAIRAFFAARDVLEVETPALSQAGATDPHLHSFLAGSPTGNHRYFLHTSPEYPMKRLLAAGSGSIYQLCKVFRAGESGRRHNPEFTLLEWYRTGFDARALMTEVDACLRQVLAGRVVLSATISLTYRDAFLRHAAVDPLNATAAQLAECLRDHHVDWQASAGVDRGMLLDLLMTHVVEPRFAPDSPTFVYDYPADQAALARLIPGDPPVAARFEVYLGGLELANGFHELTDPIEQRRRFEADLHRRAAQDLASMPVDEHLLAALAHGLPDCAGVALGVDRLLMIAAGAASIQEVLAFPTDRA